MRPIQQTVRVRRHDPVTRFWLSYYRVRFVVREAVSGLLRRLHLYGRQGWWDAGTDNPWIWHSSSLACDSAQVAHNRAGEVFAKARANRTEQPVAPVVSLQEEEGTKDG